MHCGYYWKRVCHMKIRSSGFSVISFQWEIALSSLSSPRTNSLTFSSENIYHHQCYLHTTNILLNPNPVYFFNWTMILQFSGCFLWSLNCSSFEKSYIFLLLEHQTFFEATSLLFSRSVTLAYSFEDFSMKTPWKEKLIKYCSSNFLSFFTFKMLLKMMTLIKSSTTEYFSAMFIWVFWE